jgi:FkbM family methyltransferase
MMPKMISYAQNHEDVLLRRAFADQPSGFYMDIGAHDPIYDSVTKHFYDHGWSGINVEPIPHKMASFRAARPRDINLNVGLSNQNGRMSFYEVVEGPTMSSFSPELAARYRQMGYTVVERETEILTLASVWETHAATTVDFVSLDVEGHESQVLAGANFAKWRPRVLVIEATRPGSSVLSHEEWEPLILNADYLFATFDGLNRYYVRREDPQLAERLSVPANVFDNYVDQAQHQLQEQLIRYRSLNPARRIGTWVSDVAAAVPRKLRASSNRQRVVPQ